jgi:sterol desaturase/sphingolipid hydroxylase (fatty acid hydroxylase superfamily)
MAYILYAVPIFILLMALELVVDRWRGTGYYRWSDSINSLSVGSLSQVSGLLIAAFGVAFVHEHFALFKSSLALFTLSSESLWVWVLAFFLQDLAYYWGHRFSHERNLFWAAHVVHHQSEEFNITTALRQEGTTYLTFWIFQVPMGLALALLGIPPVVLATVAVFILYYQVWVHTRLVPKLGWFEWIFVTPSHHRVHHAQNPIYMDRNHGGVLIIWDRLFGTYQEERDDEPVTFGITTPLASWNPLWANVQFYAQLWRDAVHASSWWDKLRIWFMPTGWRPADVAARYPLVKAERSQFVKFDVPVSAEQKIYTLFPG